MTTSNAVLPTDEELENLGLGLDPDTTVWRRASDARSFTGAGCALLLQVAHPTVGAGVAEHSNFKAEPWDRLFRTLDYLNLFIYGGEAAVEVGKRVREMHKTIKGTKPNGERYHALEPEAYAWVHGTLAYTIIRSHELFGYRMTPAEYDDFWQDWVSLGRFLGVRRRDMPDSWPAFMEWFDEIVDTRLERNVSTDDVIVALMRPAAPPGLPSPIWKVLRVPPAQAVRITTAGLLPERLRPRLGLSWSTTDERLLQLMSVTGRALNPLLPRRLREIGPEYLKLRDRQIEKGEYAGIRGGTSRELTAA